MYSVPTFESIPLKQTIQKPTRPARKGSQTLRWMVAGIIVLSMLAPLGAKAETISTGETLTLSRAVSIALKNQPTIAIVRSTVKANEAKIGQAKAGYYPEIIVKSGYTTGYASPDGSSSATGTGQITGSGSSTGHTSISSRNSGGFETISSSIELTQNIYDFGKTSNQVAINTLNTQSSRLDLSNTEDQVVFNVKQAYYNLIQAQRNRETAKESVRQFQEHLEQARGFYQAGTKAKFDVTKAEVDLSKAQLDLITAENQVRTGRVTLNNAMGLTDLPDYKFDETLLFIKYGLPFEEALSKAYARRPDLLSLVKKKDAARQQIALARTDYYPSVTGTASGTYTAPGLPLREGWSLGASFSVPLFSGFLTDYKVAEAQANLNTAIANEQSLRLTIYSDVQQAYLDLRAAAEKITNTELTVRQARENVDIANGRYQAGVGSPLDVTDALVGLTTAQFNYTGALVAYKNAQAAIEKAIGAKE